MITPKQLFKSETVFGSFGISEARVHEIIKAITVKYVEWLNDGVEDIVPYLEACFAESKNEYELALIGHSVGRYLSLKEFEGNPMYQLTKLFQH